MTKLPESTITTSLFRRDKIIVSYYNEAQMLQFRRDALEEAAKLCEHDNFYGVPFAEILRKLKDEK